jgi:3-keto-5-aminohexanoate cleavage enzyme
MNTDRIDWDRVHNGLERERHRMIWRPYGLPTIVDPEKSAFVDGPIQTPWDIPERMIVSTAITGAFFTADANPAQPITPQRIYEEARACAAAGASTVHIHVRDDKGYNTLSLDRFSQVIDPLREEFPQLAVDGCLVTALDGEWDEMKRVLDAGTLDAVPVNTAAVYTGDALFAKPVPVILEKARLVQESGAKVLIAAYTDGDISNADRYLIKSGLVDTPSYWCILPALPGCSPMENPRQMMDGLLRMASAIYDVDPEATILVCAAGRAAMYVVTAAALLGLHVRVGMEDTVWLWPHRDEKVQSNLQYLEMAKSLAQVLGRDVASHEEYRRMVGMPVRESVAN